MNDNPYSVGEQPTLNDTNLQGPEFEGAVRGMQIVAAALMIGAFNFLFVVVLTNGGDVFGLKQPALITVIAAVIGAIMIGAHFTVPGMIARSQLKTAASQGLMGQDEESQNEKALLVYRTQLIVGLALLEGAAFLNLAALMIDKSESSLAVFALLICLMLLKFPTRTKVTWWVQDKLRELQM